MRSNRACKPPLAPQSPLASQPLLLAALNRVLNAAELREQDARGRDLQVAAQDGRLLGPRRAERRLVGLCNQDVLALHVPPTQELVESVAEAGTVGTISARPETFKSWLAGEIAHNVASGGSVLGRLRVVKRRKARVNPKYEHWYWVQPKADPEAFLALADLITREGEPGKFAEARYRYLTLGPWTYWVSRSFYDRGALIVHRRRADHDQGDGLTFADDWHEGLAEHEQTAFPLDC